MQCLYFVVAVPTIAHLKLKVYGIKRGSRVGIKWMNKNLLTPWNVSLY